MIDRQKAADLAGRTSDRPYQQSQLPSDNRLFDLRVRFALYSDFLFTVCSIYLCNRLSFICVFHCKEIKGKNVLFLNFCEEMKKCEGNDDKVD